MGEKKNVYNGSKQMTSYTSYFLNQNSKKKTIVCVPASGQTCCAPRHVNKSMSTMVHVLWPDRIRRREQAYYKTRFRELGLVFYGYSAISSKCVNEISGYF